MYCTRVLGNRSHDHGPSLFISNSARGIGAACQTWFLLPAGRGGRFSSHSAFPMMLWIASPEYLPLRSGLLEPASRGFLFCRWRV